MDSPVGKIVAIRSASVTVAVPRMAACPRCAAGKGCGAGLPAGTNRQAMLEVPLPETSEYHEGDHVVLALNPSCLLRATILVYGLPLLGMVLALATGALLSQPLTDGVAILWAGAGLFAGLMAGRRQLNRHECLKQFVPTIEGKADAVGYSG